MQYGLFLGSLLLSLHCLYLLASSTVFVHQGQPLDMIRRNIAFRVVVANVWSKVEVIVYLAWVYCWFNKCETGPCLCL